MAKQREYLVATYINGGVIQVINSQGFTELYAQRGLSKLAPHEATTAIERGLLDPKAFALRELPAHISIHFEDPSVQGKCVATFDKSALYR